MDTERVRGAMAGAFSRDLDWGTVHVEGDESRARLNGGNWGLTWWTDGRVDVELPVDDPNYHDEDPDALIENVLGPEVEESLRVLDASLDGTVVRGLRASQDSWSSRLGDRLSAAP